MLSLRRYSHCKLSIRFEEFAVSAHLHLSSAIYGFLLDYSTYALKGISSRTFYSISSSTMGSSVNVASYDHGGFKVVVLAVLLIVMQLLMVGGRLTSRKLRKTGFGADDYVLLLATVFTLGLCALAIAFPRIAGIGAYMREAQMKSSPEGKLLGQTFIAWILIYGLSIALAKCAILLLYTRVFTTSNRFFTVGVYLIGFFVVATGIVNTFVPIFQCSPVAYEWNKSIRGGKCIDEVAFARYMAIPNVITGAVMLIMPIPLVWRLNLNLSAKIAVTATVLHGIIGFIASCARLSILFKTKESTFDSNNSIAWTIWTINEAANYIIAACLPTLRPLYLHIFPSSIFVLSGRRGVEPYTSAQKVSPTPESTASEAPLELGSVDTRGFDFPWDAHSAQCSECWVDVEASRFSDDE